MAYSVEESLEPKLEWLQQSLDLDDAAVGKMIQRLPALLGYNVNDNLELKLDWLQQYLDLNDDEISKMIQLLPALLIRSVKENLEKDWNGYNNVSISMRLRSAK